jgi:hypothetical protein
LGGAAQKYDPAWFNTIKKAMGCIRETLVDDKVHTPISVLTSDWVFQNVREYLLPYEKRTYMTNSTSLITSNWASWAADQISHIETSLFDGCKVVSQIQNFGGKHSQFRVKDDKQTAFSWRDSTICCVLDCFYHPNHRAQANALAWQTKNDQDVKSYFSQQDKRVLWSSYGNRNLDQVWPFYYESKEKYNRLCNIKKRVDPNGIFTPNSFCVGAPSQIGDTQTHLKPPIQDASFDEGAMVDKLKSRQKYHGVIA